MGISAQQYHKKDLHAYTWGELIARYQVWAPHSELEVKNWVLLVMTVRSNHHQTYSWRIYLRDSGKLIGGEGSTFCPASVL
jgi:hypothetical protein